MVCTLTINSDETLNIKIDYTSSYSKYSETVNVNKTIPKSEYGSGKFKLYITEEQAIEENKKQDGYLHYKV